MIVSAHQVNYLPGLSVMEKCRSADAVILLDTVQYSHGGWSNRNKMPDGSWLTVPVCRDTDMARFNEVRISEHGDWRTRHIRTLHQHYGHAEMIERVCDEISRPYGLLIGLNLAIWRLLLDETHFQFQSHLDGGNAVTAVSEEPPALLPISERLAMMVTEVGGDTYLSGPSGRHYLSEMPFLERGINVEYFEWDGPNPCSLATICASGVAS